MKGASTPEQRKEIAVTLSQLIQSGLTQRGDHPRKWAEGEQMYRGDPIPSHMPLPGVSGMDIPYNIVAPRVDQLTAAVVGTITSQQPYMMAYLHGKEKKKEDVEQLMQFFFALSDLHTCLENAMPKVAICGLCPVMVEYGDLSEHGKWGKPEEESPLEFSLEDLELPRIVDEDDNDLEEDYRRPGLKFHVIHPNDFCVFPIRALTISKAKLVGHRFWLRRKEVEELQESGVWFKGTVSGGDIPSMHDQSDRAGATGENDAVSSEPDDEMVELWDLVIRLDLDGDGFEEGYRCIVASGQQMLLKIEPYEYSRPHYFDLRFHREVESFWNAVSKVHLVKPIQLRVNELVNILHNGLIFSMIPPIFGDFGMPSESLRYNAGEMIPVDPTGQQPYQLQVRFNPSIGTQLLAQYENQADALFRISKAALGQQFNSRTTASEVGSVMAGQQLGIDHDIGAVGLVLREMYEFAQEVLKHKWNDWYPIYKDVVQIESERDLDAPIRWELNGKSPMMTPMGTIQRLLTLINIGFDPRVLQALAQKQENPKMYEEVGFLDPTEVVRTALNQLQFGNAERLLPSLKKDEPKNDFDLASSLAGMAGIQADAGEGVGATDGPLPPNPWEQFGGVESGAGEGDLVAGPPF